MIRLFAVIERDLKKFRRNPVVLAMSILMPIIYLLILGNSFQGKLQALPVVIVDQDAGPYAKRLTENLRAIEAGPKTFMLLSSRDQNEAVDGVKRGSIRQRLLSLQISASVYLLRPGLRSAFSSTM